MLKIARRHGLQGWVCCQPDVSSGASLRGVQPEQGAKTKHNFGSEQENAGEGSVDRGGNKKTGGDGVNGNDTLASFNVEESGILCNDTEVVLSGETYAGDPITGFDTIDATECEFGHCHD